MKRTHKITAILLAILLLSCAIGISSLASGDSPVTEPADGYYFQVYNPASDTVTKYTDPEAFNSVIASAADGAVITLLWDIEEDENSGIINVGAAATEAAPRKIYWDLNGHYYSFVRKTTSGTAVCFDICDNVELNIYSSMPGGRIYNYYKEGAAKPNALFWLRYKNAALNLGEVTLEKTLNYDNLTPTSTQNVFIGVTSENVPVTHSGDNLSTYSAALVGIIDNGVNDANIRVNIKGGTYSHNEGNTALIVHSANEAAEAAPIINVEDATLVSTYSNIYNTQKASSANSPTGSIRFKNCLIYSTSSVIGAYHNTVAAEFDNCKFAGYVGSISNGITLNRCLFTDSAILPTAKKLVKTNETRTVSFDTYSLSHNADGTVNKNCYNLPIKNTFTVNYTAATANVGEYASVTWNTESVLGDGEVVTEDWLLGSTPVPPAIAPMSTEVYKYLFDNIAEVTGDTVYTLTPRVNFPLKANLNLHSDMVYNIYIPTSVYSSVNFVKINGAAVTADTSFTTDISGTSYYKLSHHVSAYEATEAFILEINVDGYNSTDFTQSYEFSVEDYVERVRENGYTTAENELMDATLSYIHASHNYSVNSNDYTVSVPVHVGSEPDDMSGIDSIIGNISFIAGDKLVYRVELNQSVQLSDSDKNVILTIPNYNTHDTVYLTAEDWSVSEDSLYYEFEIRAIDLLDGIGITLGTEQKDTPDYIYYLSNYIYYVNQSSENTHLITLMSALWNYANKVHAYTSDTVYAPAIAISVGGKKITSLDYVILALTDAEKNAAEYIRDAIKEVSGVELLIKESSEGYENFISVTQTSPSSAYDFKASVDGNNLLLECGYASFVEKANESFAREYISSLSDNYNFASDFTAKIYTDRIYYSDFGAVGDGITEDFEAIKAAHDMANQTKNHTVYADDDATYYIHETRSNGGIGSAQTIQIKTNVNWGNAKFIIDDSDIGYYDGSGRASKNIFNVASDYAEIKITDSSVLSTLAGIGEGTKRINLGLGYPALLTVYNAEHKVYRRKGYSSEDGADQHEVILIDEDGNVDDSTPFMFNYEKVTSLYIRRTDIKPVTITGGEFTTKASRVNIYKTTYNEETGSYELSTNGAYFTRGINVNRSYTTLNGVKHYVVGEITPNEQRAGTTDAYGNIIPYAGTAYQGFFYASSATDVTFKDCVLTGRRCYTKISSVGGGTTGTYDFGANLVNKIILEGCVQSNFWMTLDENGTPTGQVNVGTDSETGLKTFSSANADAVLSMSSISVGGKGASSQRICWGIGGTNYCKNMEYQNSLLSRFDAHCGLLNGKIEDSTVTFMALVGKGEMLIRNTTWISPGAGQTDNSMIFLRNDYGSPWEGTITIKDCTAQNSDGGTYLIYHRYTNWYFGYDCYFPNVVVDNLTFTNLDENESVNFLAVNWLSYHPDYNINCDKTGTTAANAQDNENVVVPPDYIKIINNNSNHTYYIPASNSFFKGTYIELDGEILNGGASEFDTPFISFD